MGRHVVQRLHPGPGDRHLLDAIPERSLVNRFEVGALAGDIVAKREPTAVERDDLIVVEPHIVGAPDKWRREKTGLGQRVWDFGLRFRHVDIEHLRDASADVFGQPSEHRRGRVVHRVSETDIPELALYALGQTHVQWPITFEHAVLAGAKLGKAGRQECRSVGLEPSEV